MRLKLDPALEVMRDVDAAFTWYDLVPPLQTAMQMATDLNLLYIRKVLSDTISRGVRMTAACSNPLIVLGMFSKMLPSVQGVCQELHEANCAELRKVHASQRAILLNRPR